MKKIISMFTVLTSLLPMGLTFAEAQPSGDGNVDTKGPTKEEISIDQSRMMKTKTKSMGIGTDSLGESCYTTQQVYDVVDNRLNYILY